MHGADTHLAENPFHPNQITASDTILNEFNTKYYVQLQAQMQSGKTGCGLYTAFQMLANKTIQNCFIISGMSDISIKSQWQNEIRTLGQSYLNLFSDFNTFLMSLFLIGILNGIIFAIITAIIVQLWFKELNLSLLIGISMILNMIVAGLFGILVPVSLKKLNIDPALASSVFVTTITDVIGFLSFLGLGSFYFLN